MRNKRDLFHLAILLKDHIQNTIKIHSLHNFTSQHTPHSTPKHQPLIDFYSRPELPFKNIIFSSESLFYKLTQKQTNLSTPQSNHYSSLITSDILIMLLPCENKQMAPHPPTSQHGTMTLASLNYQMRSTSKTTNSKECRWWAWQWHPFLWKARNLPKTSQTTQSTNYV